MYKIIGGDQKEYGPVSSEQLIGWIRDHRANAQTLIQKEGGPWVPLGSLPEFAEFLGTSVPGAGAGAPPSFGAAPSAPTGSGPVGGGFGGGAGVGGGGLGGGFGGFDSGGAGDARAREMVSGPATALLVTGILFVVLALVSLVLNLSGAGSFRPPPGEIPPQTQEILDWLEKMKIPLAIAGLLYQLAISALLIFAAQKLRRLESLGLVVTATILSMIPCFNCPGCCLGLPIGIWVLVVLFKPEVKSAFR